MEQFGDRGARLWLREGLCAVDRLVAGILQAARLEEDGVAGDLAETRLVHEGAEVVLIRELQPAIRPVQPGHGEFEGAARVEGGGARIGEHQAFRTRRRLVDVWPFGFEEAELGHVMCPGRPRRRSVARSNTA